MLHNTTSPCVAVFCLRPWPTTDAKEQSKHITVFLQDTLQAVNSLYLKHFLSQ